MESAVLPVHKKLPLVRFLVGSGHISRLAGLAARELDRIWYINNSEIVKV